MRHYTTILNLVADYCHYLESEQNGKGYKLGLSYKEVLKEIESENIFTLKEWIKEMEESKIFKINVINKYNKLNGAEIVLATIKATIRNKIIYDILESN